MRQDVRDELQSATIVTTGIKIVNKIEQERMKRGPRDAHSARFKIVIVVEVVRVDAATESRGTLEDPKGMAFALKQQCGVEP